LEEKQQLPSNVTRDWHLFAMDGITYAVSSRDGGVAFYIYNATTLAWQANATLAFPGIMVEDTEFFEIDGERYLAICFEEDNQGVQVRRYNRSTLAWDLHQVLSNAPSSFDVEAWTVDGTHFLGVTSYKLGTLDSGYATKSPIFRWDTTLRLFQPWFNISTNGGSDLEVFRVQGATYVAVAEFSDGGGVRSLDSHIYRMSTGGLTLAQSVPTFGADDWEFFEREGEAYLLVANFMRDNDSSSNNGLARMYRANGCA
jgi:hypothetical protein